MCSSDLQRFEEAFYSGKRKEAQRAQAEDLNQADASADLAALAKLLANPETAGLLKALVKAMGDGYGSE